MKNEFFPESEPLSVEVTPSLELSSPINRCNNTESTAQQ